MTTRLYHYSDTARLPWILDTGDLRVGRNKIGNFPDPDFLWATPRGRIVVAVTKHMVAVLDHVVHDTWDCWRGRRRVYGYYEAV
jgi:hypothetical protein